MLLFLLRFFIFLVHWLLSNIISADFSCIFVCICVGFLVAITTLNFFPLFTLSHLLLSKLFLSEVPKKRLESRDCVIDSNFQQTDRSHSLASVKPSQLIRSVSFSAEP